MDPAELAGRFGLGSAARLSDGPVARGRQGEVWRLDTAEGTWAVKVPFRPVGEHDVRRSAAFQEAAHAAGVTTPQVRRTTDGEVLATVSGRKVRVYSWVDLGPPDPRLDPALVGALVAALHQVPEPLPCPPPGRRPDPGAVEAWYQAPLGAERWQALVARLQAEGAPFADRLAALCEELVALESWIEPPEVLRTCHRDLWADNVLPTADGGVCVIDWENSGPADPSQELGCVLFEFARGDAGRVRTLYRAYREAGGPATVDRRGHFSMLVAQLGHITETAAKDWLRPNPRSPDRADAAAWVGEVLDEPHTRELLDSLLRDVGATDGRDP